MTWVLLPSQLQSYSAGLSRVQARGDTVENILRDLDSRFPGLKFRVLDEQDRIRRHMRIFVGGEAVSDVRRSVRHSDEVMIFGALSGG
jgi:molybdopterin converting factor small subunit